MRVVFKIGGSVIASPINTDLIRRYTNLFNKIEKQGHKIVIVVGGGKIAREFIKIAKELDLEEKDQDIIAISVSRILALLFIKKIGIKACKIVPLTIEEAARYLAEGKIVVMGGLKPGMTTDTVAALIGEKIEAQLLLKLTDQDGIYNKDPRKHNDAIKLKKINLEEISSVLSEKKHKAGIHQIIDPEAVKVLKRKKIKVIVINGFNPENVISAIKGKTIGTVIC